MRQQYIDTVHNARIQLTDLQQEVFELLQDEVERLKGIRNLGIVTRVLPSAYHTKFDHQLGVIHLLQRAQKAGLLPESFPEPFEIAAATSHIGHLPFTYATEHALLLSANKHERIANKILEHCAPLDEISGGCKKCGTTGCTVKNTPPSDLLQSVIKRHGWRRLYRFFTAVKIFTHKELRHIVESKKECAPELLRIVLGQRCELHTKLARLDRLDYTLRDLAYASAVHLHLNVDELIGDEKALEWSLLERIEKDYLENNVYNNPQVRVRRTLFEKAMAGKFVEKPDLFKRLLKPGEEISTEDGFIKEFGDELGFNDVLADDSDEFREYWELDVEPYHDTSVAFEQDLIDNEDIFAYPRAMNALIVVGGRLDHYLRPRSSPHKTLVAVRCFENPDKADLPAFMGVMRQISRQFPYYADASGIHKTVFEFLIGRPASPFFQGRLFKVISSYILKEQCPGDFLQSVEDVLTSATQPAEGTDSTFELGFGDLTVPLNKPLHGATLDYLLTSVLMKDDDPRTRQRVALRLAKAILINAHAVCSAPADDLRTLLKTLRGKIGQAALDGGDGEYEPGDLLEAFAFLDILCRRQKNYTGYRWLAANLKLRRRDEETDKGEYDIVQVSFSENGRITVDAWGCTRVQRSDLHSKKKADLGKLRELRADIQDRFSNVTVHVDGYYWTEAGHIWEDFHGNNRRRT